MGALSAVVYTPPLTTVNAGAIMAGLPGAAWRMARDHRGERVGTTLGDWAVWAALQASFPPTLLPIMTLEPWAVPLTGTYGPGAVAYPAGLYYVTDRIPREGSGLGYVLYANITGASPSLTVHFSDGSSTVVPIPEGLTGTYYYSYIDTPKTITAFTASGCSPGYYSLGLPPGVLVDPRPENWLPGYAPATVHPSTAQPAIFDGNDSGGHDGFVVADATGVADRAATAGCTGHAALPRYGHWPRLGTTTTPWYGPEPYLEKQYGFARPVVAAADGTLSEQNCGPSSWGGRWTEDAVQDTLGSVLSAPMELHLVVDGTYNTGGDTRTVTIAETEMDGSSPVTVYTESFSDTGGPTTYVRTLSIPLRPFKRYRFTYAPAQDRDLTAQPRISGYLFPSWRHPLPFTVVAIDGTVIPGGVAAAFLGSADHPPTVTTATAVGMLEQPTTLATCGWVARWQGLPPGLYSVLNGNTGAWVRDTGGGARSLATSYTTHVLAPTGRFEVALPVAHPSAGYLTVAAVTVTHSALALGANAIPASSYPPAYAWRQFTASTAGTYRFAISGTGAIDTALAFSLSEPLCCSEVVGRIRNYNRRQPTIQGRLSTPPTSATVVGLRTYLVGDSPTGAWSGHAGELAAGILGPEVVWQFWRPSPGDVFAVGTDRWAVDAAGKLVNTSTTALGSVDIDLAEGQTVYVRCGITPDVAARSSEQHSTRGSEYDLPGARAHTITVAAI